MQVKKDYLNEGAMADSADLVVLGGWFGTGAKGGILSIFLMGCHDGFAGRWRTVTKVLLKLIGYKASSGRVAHRCIRAKF